MKLICDTSVWYEVGARRLAAAALKRRGRLVASPIAFLELTSGLAGERFERRRDAAGAIVQSADEIADDSEMHLARIWGIERSEVGIDWRGFFQAVAEAKSLEEITQGVPDRAANVIRAVNVNLAQAWRSFHWEDFREKILDLMEGEMLGYRAGMAGRKVPYLSGRRRGEFGNKVLSAEYREATLLATCCRAQLHVEGAVAGPTKEQIDKARVALGPYVEAYAQYLIGCATKFTPSHNDWGDLELFVYLQGDARLVTLDKRWIGIIGAGGLQNQWLDARPLVGSGV